MSKKDERERRIANSLELPLDTLFDLPRTVIVGCRSVSIDNFRGIIDYTDDTVRVNTRESIICVRGEGLEIGEIDGGGILICGNIVSVDFS